jgi:DNA-binding Lrp family transcriptional regulator
VRYESAVKIVRFLKSTYGTPVPILRISQSVGLSYQPTHKHVRALERQGTIETAKQGREVLCRLKATEAAHLWLGMVALEDRARLAQGGEIVGQMAGILREAMPDLPTEGLEALALRSAGADETLRVVMFVESYARESLRRHFMTRCGDLAQGAVFEVYTFAEVAAALADPLEHARWIAESTPLYGQQRFWEAVLPCGQAPALVDSL